MKKKILILGQNGQLAKTLANKFKKNKVPYKSISSKKLNFLYPNKIKDRLKKYNFDIIVNCFAYTNVDRSEIEKKKTFKINCQSVEKLSTFCKDKNILLIHFSTDYIFDGKFKTPILEHSKQQPLNYYGFTKARSEKSIIKSGCKYLIFRISWTYSLYGKNFVKTIINKLKEGKKFEVVDDQYGCPTNLDHFVEILIKVIKLHLKQGSDSSYIFNYSHNGVTNWFKFAKLIEKILYPKLKSLITPISSKNLSSLAKRPIYSKLSNKKLSKFLKIKQDSWDFHLKNFLEKYYL